MKKISVLSILLSPLMLCSFNQNHRATIADYNFSSPKKFKQLAQLK